MSDSLDPFRLTLPSDVMDQVVARLPPPGPKLVPAIIMEFRGLDNEVYVSQAVSKEERDMIFSGPSLYWSERTNVYWCSHMRHLSRTSVYSAKFLGFKFETENDRVSYEKLLEDPRKFVTITLVKKRAK